MTMHDRYEELIRRAKEITVLGSCSAVLSWDQETYMPALGAANRSEQQALLAGLRHQKAADPRLGELLGEIEGTELVRDPESVESVNVRELRRNYDRATRLPQQLVEELARTTALAQRRWAEARARSCFADFQPWLDKIIGLKREEADALGHDGERYDPLLDTYEPGAKTDQVARLFSELRSELVPLVSAIGAATRRPKTEVLRRHYPVDRQVVFGESAAAAVGFDFRSGRLDVTTHPFCSGMGPGDCRITTRYDANDFNDGFFSILHETGHGLYEQGLDPQHYGTPMGEAVSLGVHESQSRLWENLVGRSRPFWDHFFPRARQTFPAALHDVSLDDFVFAVNAVQPSLIRVDADEVTYNLHVIIRFELERAMLAGDLGCEDVPGAWNEKYRDFLGVSPPNDAQGCLQDVHWSCGGVGYFPTYTLGNLYAAQLFDQAKKELGDLAAMFSRGEFAPLLDWLRRRVHRQGQRHRSSELVRQVTGSPPSHRPFMDRLRREFGERYGL